MLVAGVDEAGRGCLFGPVYAAAVILDPAAKPIRGLDDSRPPGDATFPQIPDREGPVVGGRPTASSDRG